jgi:peptide/nickel transport system substrate-binding protein
MVIGSAQNQAEMSIMAAGWRRAGFDIKENVFGTAQARNGEARATIPGMATTSLNGGDYALGAQTSRSIPSPPTRWTGNNRGGWSNAEYDRLFETYSVTLSQTERTHLLAQMAKTLMDDVPIFPLFFNSTTVAFVDGLTGPQPVVLAADVSWNVYEWQFK